MNFKRTENISVNSGSVNRQRMLEEGQHGITCCYSRLAGGAIVVFLSFLKMIAVEITLEPEKGEKKSFGDAGKPA